MDYSENQFNTMQQEAVRRVREMQRRSQSLTESSQPSLPIEDMPPKAEQKPPEANRQHYDNGKNPPYEKGRPSLIAGLKIDEEKAMIALLIYILYKQGADVKLLLALGYLLI